MKVQVENGFFIQIFLRQSSDKRLILWKLIYKKKEIYMFLEAQR